MEVIYCLHVQSTGELIMTGSWRYKRAEKHYTLAGWQSYWERKILKNRSRAERFKEAVRVNDTIAGWYNFDDLVASGVSADELHDLHQYIFRGYEAWHEKRLQESVS